MITCYYYITCAACGEIEGTNYSTLEDAHINLRKIINKEEPWNKPVHSDPYMPFHCYGKGKIKYTIDNYDSRRSGSLLGTTLTVYSELVDKEDIIWTK